MRKSLLFLALVVFSLVLIGTATAPPGADAGEYIGRICWGFLENGATSGLILRADITYMGGDSSYQLTYNGLLLIPAAGGMAIPIMGPMFLSGGGLGFEGYVGTWQHPASASPPSEGGMTYFKAIVFTETLEGFYNSVTINFNSSGMDHETESGTVVLIPCPF